MKLVLSKSQQQPIKNASNEYTSHVNQRTKDNDDERTWREQKTVQTQYHSVEHAKQWRKDTKARWS